LTNLLNKTIYGLSTFTYKFLKFFFEFVEERKRQKEIDISKIGEIFLSENKWKSYLLNCF